MAPNRDCEQISAILKDFFDAGIEIGADILFFAESTYGVFAEELENVLYDRDSEEREVLLGLIFFPDHALRIGIEPLVGDEVFSRADEAGLIERLVSQVKSVTLRLPQENDSLIIEATRPLLVTFVEKLYLCRHLDAEILKALDDHCPEIIVHDARVFLRCKHYEYPERVRRFLCTFIKNAARMENSFTDLFELTASLASHVPDGADIEKYFTEQLFLQKKIARSLREFEEKRDRYGMEYLLMQKYPVPHDSPEEVNHRVQLLTTIVTDILQIKPSRTNFIGHQDLGHFHSEDDIDLLFKRLS
jgi:hypothetical protein